MHPTFSDAYLLSCFEAVVATIVLSWVLAGALFLVMRRLYKRRKV